MKDNGHKAYILRFLRQAQRRLSLAVFTDVTVKALAAGFGAAAAVNMAALLIPIYGAFAISWIALGITLLCGAIYAIVHFPDYKRTALEIDRRGLKERLTTFVELEKSRQIDLGSRPKIEAGKIEVGRIESEKRGEGKKAGISSGWVQLQAEDAYRAVTEYDLKGNTPIQIKKRPACFLAAMIALFVVAAVIPSPNKELAIARHEQKEKAKAEIEKLEEAKNQLEELEKMENLTEADLKEIEKFKDVLDKAKEELAKAETEKELEKALERMEAKTRQNLAENRKTASKDKALDLQQKLEEFLKQVENKSRETFTPEELKDILDAKTLEDFKEMLEETLGEMSEEELAALLEELEDGLAEGSISKEQLEQLAKAVGKLSPSDGTAGQLAQIAEGTLGIPSSSGQSASNQNGTGSGASNGGKNGSGTGGSGGSNGNGGGSGIGGGKNRGGKNGIEKENNRVSRDEKITIPGREAGKDENLTGKPGEGESYQTTGGEGLAWAGEKVNYNEVIGEYTTEAYSRIENNQVPKGMEDVVKSYFEEINQ